MLSLQASNLVYGKCRKILYIKVSDKMAYANGLDPDQTAPEGGPTLFAIPQYFMKEW